jgi:hypothetical protein
MNQGLAWTMTVTGKIDLVGPKQRGLALGINEFSGYAGVSLGGFVGDAEYEGELGEFMAYLLAGKWTGVGRQTVWGKGELEALSD